MPTPLSSRSAVRRKATLLGVLLGLVLGGWALTAQAFLSLAAIPGFYVPQVYYKFGAVYTRTIVPGPNGRPVYVEYDISGKEAREIGEATGKFERAKVMPGDSYRALLKRKDDTRARYPTSEVMTAAAYRGKTFKTVTGETITKPGLDDGVLTVLVRPDKELFTTDGKELVLLQLTIKDGVTPDAASKSLLLSPEGDILAQTANTIGFRVGFFGKDGKVSDTLVRDRDAKIYGPMAGVGVSLGSHVLGGYGMTDSAGKYTMNYFLPACPGFFFEYTTPAYLELYYKRFNPRGGSHMVYYMTKPDYDTCNGMGVWSLAAAMIVATSATPVKRAMDFPVDLMVIDGTATVKNAKVSDSTAYSAETSDRERYLQEKYDFDGDEKPEFVVPGKKVTKTVDGKPKEVFVTTSVKEAELQGIYLSSRYDSAPANTEETAPDFTRLIDTAPDFKDRGLLDSITKEDLKDTDIYVFRESNGQLVAERRGLHEDELYKSYSGVDEAKEAFRFSIQLRGSVENYYAIAGRTGEANFAKWQSAGGFKEEFQKRTANHLKAGEQVRIIAINRPTGYVGSKTFQLQSSLSGNVINVNSQMIQMGPPNLKIWAERKSKIEAGMTKGEQKKQLIGNEGAGLGSDISIAIYTDWRDADGSPLPEELADYGYTGRLAKIVAANQLAPVGANSLSQFKIKPGQQVQVIQLPEKLLAKQHLYLQVTGQPENRNPDFSSSGAGTGILKYRPDHYVPVMVPLHDEEGSDLATQAYRKAKRKNSDLDLKKPEPIYSWKYRPEMQFSLYELNVKEVRRVDADGKESNVLSAKKPTLAGSDKYVAFIYDLLKSSIASLDSWDYKGERELVLAMGEQEVKATVGTDQSIKLDNISHLSLLDSTDFLSIRLFANNDAGNLLYEFAFEYLALDTMDPQPDKWKGEVYEMSADKTDIGLQAWLVGFTSRKDKPPKPVTVWSVEGSGNLQVPGAVTGNEEGYFENKLTMPTRAGATAVISVHEQGDSTTAKLGTFKVIPGEVKNISLQSSGTSSAFESGQTTVTARLTDQFGNPVIDGTPVDWFVDGDASLKSWDTIAKGGASTAVLLGGGKSGAAIVKAKAGSVEKTTDVQVRPLDIVLSAPTIVRPGELFEVAVTVKDGEGKPVSSLFFMPTSSVGRVQKDQAQTDGSGTARYRVQANPKLQTGNVGVVIGEQRKVVNVRVERAPQSGSVALENTLLLIGDKTTAGTVSADWAAEARIDVPYEVQGQVSVSGKPGEHVTLTIGSAGISAYAPILSYAMGTMFNDGVIPDSIGRADAIGQNIQITNDSPLGVGSSFEFSKSVVTDANSQTESGIRADLKTVPLPSENLGFRVDLKVLESGGTVFQIGDGQKLVLDSAGRLSYSIRTSDAEATVTSAPLTVGEWNNVVGRYTAGVLSLDINNDRGDKNLQRFSAPLTGAAEVNQQGEILIVGKDLVGRMRGFELFDFNSQPMAVFDNGNTSKEIQLDEQGAGKALVKSTGVFGTGVTPDASTTRIQKLPLTLEYTGVSASSSVDYLTIVTEAAYQTMIEMQASNSPLPDSALASVNSNVYRSVVDISLPRMFTVANAGYWDWVPTPAELRAAADKAVTIAAEAATWVVPYDDVLIIAEQLEYLANGDERFNAMLLTASSLSVLSVIPTPFTKALKPIMKPIKALAKIVGKGKFGVAFGKKFLSLARGCVEEKGKGVACATLQAVLPFIEAVGYMYLTDPEGFQKILDSIKSEEDFLTLFEFMMMDIDPDWFGVDEPTTAGIQMLQPSLQYLGVSVANAKTGSVEKFSEKLLKAFKKISKDTGDNDLMAVIRPIVKAKDFLKTRPNVLKLLVNVKTLKTFGLLVKNKGADIVVGVIKGYSGQRIPQPIVWGMLYYLLVEKSGDMSEEMKGKLYTLIGIAFFDIGQLADEKLCNVDTSERDIGVRGRLNNANGALYQLSQIAGEFLIGHKVSDIEKTFNVQIKTKLGTSIVRKVGEHNRRVDIVSEREGKEFYIEVKSYAGRRGNTTVGGSRMNGTWKTLGESKTIPMKEFLLDQIIVGPKDQQDKFAWRFDSFKTSGPYCGGAVSGFDNKLIEMILVPMKKLPPWFNNSHARGMFDMSKDAYETKFNGVIGTIVNNFGLVDIFLTGAMDAFMPGTKQDIDKAIAEF